MDNHQSQSLTGNVFSLHELFSKTLCFQLSEGMLNQQASQIMDEPNTVLLVKLEGRFGIPSTIIYLL